MIKHSDWGLDLWRVRCKPQVFFRICKQNQLEIFDITMHANFITFYAPLIQHRNISHAFETIEHVTTTGILGYILRSLRKPRRIFSVIIAIVLWYGLSHMVFEIDIKGEKEQSRDLIQKTLLDMGYETPFYQQDVTMIKTDLKKALEQDIAWLEIEKLGGRYRITYTPKEFASLKELQHDELIAQADGVIQRFDIEHGNKVKAVNQFVHKGDVLVSNIIDDTGGGKKEVFVEGRVFAYTWKDVTVAMPSKGMTKSFQYFELLLEARREVSKDFRKDDRISKENILQFSDDMGTIEMVVHYTLLQDITSPR